MFTRKRIRLLLIAALGAFAIFVFVAVSAPMESVVENGRRSILEYFILGQADDVRIDLNTALASTLLAVFPVAFTLMMLDIYGLRSSPVEHIGCFAYCVICITLNVVVSYTLWAVFGGWAPPVIGPVVVTIIAVTLALAFISEWRILKSIAGAE